MSEEKQDDLRYGGWLLSKLLQTPADQLSTFRDEHLDDDAVALENLAAVRMCLLGLHGALSGNETNTWQCVRQATAVLVESAASVSVPPSRNAQSVAPDHVVAEPKKRSALEPVAALGHTAPQQRGAHKTLPFKAIEAPPVRRSSLEPHPELGQTAPLRGGAPRSGLPFDSGPRNVVTAGAYSLGLEAYAKLVALRQQTDERWGSALSDAGVPDRPAFDALEAAWQRRLRADVEQQRQFGVAYAAALSGPATPE